MAERQLNILVYLFSQQRSHITCLFYEIGVSRDTNLFAIYGSLKWQFLNGDWYDDYLRDRIRRLRKCQRRFIHRIEPSLNDHDREKKGIGMLHT